MDTLLIQNKNKKLNKVKIIIITTILILIILGIAVGAYYIYSNQIVDSENISMSTSQNSKLVTLTVNIYPYIVSSEEMNILIVQNNTDWEWELPESINVKYSDGTIKTNSVSWDNRNVDISKTGAKSI